MKALRAPRFGSAACVSTFGVTAFGKAMPISEFRIHSPGPVFHRSRLPSAGKKSSRRVDQSAPAVAVTLMSAKLAERRANQRAAQAPIASALGNVAFVNGFPVPVFATNRF